MGISSYFFSLGQKSLVGTSIYWRKIQIKPLFRIRMRAQESAEGVLIQLQTVTGYQEGIISEILANFLIGRKEERFKGLDRPISVKDKVLWKSSPYLLIKEKIIFFRGA